MIMRYFDVNYKVAKQYEVILENKQLWQIKAWYEIKKSDGPVNAESEAVLKEIADKGKVLKKYWTRFRTYKISKYKMSAFCE